MMSNTNTVDWGAIAAWIALAVAIISPIITTIISNIHQTKLKHLQIIENHGLDVIEDYITLATQAIISDKVSDKYRISYAKIFLYAPKMIHHYITELDENIDGISHSDPLNIETASKIIDSKRLLMKICKELNYDNL